MHVTTGIDTERERVYQKSEQIDAQLQRMSEDLKALFINGNFYITPFFVKQYQFLYPILTMLHLLNK